MRTREERKRVVRFGRLVRERRKKAGLTVRDLAKVSGVPFSTISRMENGKDVLFAATVRILAALKINASWSEKGWHVA